MKPLDPSTIPAHYRNRKGRSGLVHGEAPLLPREYVRNDARKNRAGRKGAKARARMKRVLGRRFGIE